MPTSPAPTPRSSSPAPAFDHCSAWGVTQNPDALSADSCIHYCSLSGYLFAGMKEDVCWCGDSYGEAGQGEPGECYVECPGNDKHICGGETATSVYQPTCEGENQMSATDIEDVFSKLDDDGDSQLTMAELLDLFDGQDDDSLQVPDCAGNLGKHYGSGTGCATTGAPASEIPTASCTPVTRATAGAAASEVTRDGKIYGCGAVTRQCVTTTVPMVSTSVCDERLTDKEEPTRGHAKVFARI
eukprot:SAG22_NODE_73_length_22318_cov_47.105315_11_plen_242_part_00